MVSSYFERLLSELPVIKEDFTPSRDLVVSLTQSFGLSMACYRKHKMVCPGFPVLRTTQHLQVCGDTCYLD